MNARKLAEVENNLRPVSAPTMCSRAISGAQVNGGVLNQVATFLGTWVIGENAASTAMAQRCISPPSKAHPLSWRVSGTRFIGSPRRPVVLEESAHPAKMKVAPQVLKMSGSS